MRCSGPLTPSVRRFAAAARAGVACRAGRDAARPGPRRHRRRSPPTTSRDFRAAGMTHLTAVSGANVTIVCGAVLFSARLIGPRSAVAAGRGGTGGVRHRRAADGQRVAGGRDGRHRAGRDAVFAAATGDSGVVAPRCCCCWSLRRSWRSTWASRCRSLATAALVVIAPVWSRRLVARGCPKPLADALAVAWAAHVVTAPLVAGISGRFSLVGRGRPTWRWRPVDTRRSPCWAARRPCCAVLWPALRSC